MRSWINNFARNISRALPCLLALWSVAASAAPAIFRQPTNDWVVAGQQAAFDVGVTGQPPITFQWRRDGMNLPGATNAVFTISAAQTNHAGRYSVFVTDGGGSSVLSSQAMLTVLLPVNITAQPQPQTVAPGGAAFFSVGAMGSPLIRYQWKLNGSNLFGATNQTLLVSNVSALHAGLYSVRVWNGVNSVDSAPAALTLVAPVTITTPPSNQTAVVGSTVTFSVTATGTGPLSYQWFFENTAIEDGTNQSLTLAGVTPAEAGGYFVRVSNAVNVVSSDIVILSVSEPPSLLTQPLTQTVPAGSNVSFFVAVGGAQPLSYQWLFNGTILSNATGPNLTHNSARPEHAGDYRVIISNPFGTISSDVAHLDVTPATLPFRDHFSDAVNVGSQFYLLGTGSNTNATRESTEPMHDGEKAVRSVWLSWTAPANGVVRMNTRGSDFDTVLAVYAGASVNALTPIESDDDSGTNHTSWLSFNATAGTTYRIAIAGYLMTSGSIGFELELFSTLVNLPMFLSHPRNYSVAPGGDAHMDFAFNSDEAVQVQWLFQGNNMANTTVSNALLGVDETQVGRYRVRLTTPTHVLYSRYAEVQINSRGLSNVFAQDKIGRALDYGQLIPAGVLPTGTAKAKSGSAGGSGSHGFSTTQIFSTAGATSDPGEPVHCGIGGGHSTWFVYQAETNGTIRIDTEGSSFDTVLAVYIGPGDSYATLTNVACDNNSGSNGLSSVVTFQAAQGTTYWIAVDGVGSATGTVKLHINLGNPVTLSAQPLSQTVPSGSNVAFVVTANGMTNYTYQWRFGGTNLAGATAANFTRTNVPASLAGSYDVVVKNPINSVTSSVAVLAVYSGSLTITSQPQSQGVSVGANVSFTVGASGAGLLRYQWRFNDGSIAGATNSGFTLLNAQAANAGFYSVNVTDNNGSLLSSNAALTVSSAPVITLQPVSRTFGTGEVAQLTAAATGTPTPAYQWLFNDAPLAGETSGTLTINNFSVVHEGVYSLRASNSVGIATSAGAELLLNAPLRLMNSSWSNGVFSARLVGAVGTNYFVQCSTNATSWFNIATNNSTTGLSFFTSPNTNQGCWVFRAIAP